MKFQKGHPKLGGRKKGTPNKAKFKMLARVLAEHDINPFEEILAIMEEDSRKPEDDRRLSPGMLIQTWMDLASYCQAKPKENPAEDAGDGDGSGEDKPITPADVLSIVKGGNVS